MSTRLGGRYQLVREIGAGGMGRVFQAVDTETGRSVAAKVMIANGQDSLDALLRFYQEGAVLSTLKHPNIVEVYGTFLEEETCCIIMELLEGGSLGQVLKATHDSAQPQGMPLARIKRISQQVASALAYAHSRGIVHRDIKPDNIMLVGDDNVKVTDFGIARILRDGATLNTMTGTSIGTPLYMAPEQIEGQKVDGRADIYSLGTVIYQMITNQPPFTGTDPLTVAFKHVHKAPQPPTALNRNVPKDWEALILKMLAKDPADRFQTAAALEDAISTLSGGPVGTTSATPPAQSPPPVLDPRRRNDPLDRFLDQGSSPPDRSGASPSTAILPTEAYISPPPASAEAGQVAAERSGAAEAGPAAAPPPPARTPTKRSVPWPVAGGAALVLVALIVGLLVMRSQSPSASPSKTVIPATGNGSVFGRAGSGPGQFSSPAGLTLDAHGDVYIADAGNNRIQKLSFGSGSSGAAMTALAQWGKQGSGAGQFNDPTDVAVDAQGNVYIADAGNDRIQKLSPSGKPMDQWGAKGTGPGQFRRPQGVALDSAGNLYVADAGNNRIQKLNPAGEPVAQWGAAASESQRFNNPTGVAVDGQGHIYVADTGNNRIVELFENGKWIGAFGTSGSGPGSFTHPSAVAVDSQGNMFIADTGQNWIQELAASSDPLNQWGNGAGNVQLSKPEGVALDSHGTIYVTDTGNNRIQKITRSSSTG